MKLKSAIAILSIIFLFGWVDFAAASSARIYASLIGTNGQIVTNGFEVAPSALGVQENPRVAFFNGIFLVVWQDMRSGTNGNILAARIASDGTVLDSPPLQITNASRSQAMPDVDADNLGFVVVWQGFSGSDIWPRISLRRVNADGTMGSVVTPNLATGYGTAGDSGSPRIAWNGSEHFLSYSELGNGGGSVAALTVSGARLNTQLQIQGSPRFYEWGPSLLSVSAAPNPADGWTIIRHGPTPDPWFHNQAHMKAIGLTQLGVIASDYPSQNTQQGAIIPENWLDAQTPSGANATVAPYGAAPLAKDATYNVAAWVRYGYSGLYVSNPDIRLSRISGWHVVDGFGGVPAAASLADELNPDLAGNGAGTMLLTYEKRESGRTGIMSRLLTIGSSITVGSEITVGPNSGPGGARRAFPAVAYGTGSPNAFLVVWQEGWHGDSTVAPIGPDTTPPIINGKSPTGQLPSGTAFTAINISAYDATPPVTCKWDTSDKAYASMTHTSGDILTGLTNGSSYIIYARCKDSAPAPNINTSSYSWTFSVASSIPAKTYNLSDFINLTLDWLKTKTSTADVNSDGVINPKDLGVMMSNWE